MTGNLPAELLDKADKVVSANRTAGRRILLVESCTGGLVSAAITEIPGSSDVFDGGFVTYANEAKMAFVGVDDAILRANGAVSIATAQAMASGGIERSRADVCVAITGVAGPGGGSADKPVGTVVFARATRSGDPFAEIRAFPDDGRAAIRLQAALWALDLLMPDKTGP